ncbi:hypothetical protein FRC17_010616 [Serendipita sp. 399]|nr:hypothetical protein FRC17_010616 [Serendipita sp. 399]
MSSNTNKQSQQHQQMQITRFLACGTVYITHTLSVPLSAIQPVDVIEEQEELENAPTTRNVRAKQVTTQRGGSAANILSILAQFNAVPKLPPSPVQTAKRSSLECALVSPLGSDAAGRALMYELEAEGIRTRFCKVHQAGIPVAFVLRTDESPARTIINHNPLPDLTHEDFIAILGPILVPEHYQGLMSHHWHPHPVVPQTPAVHAVYGPGPGIPPVTTSGVNQHSLSHAPPPLSQPLTPTTPGLPSNAPFTVFHITGRSQSADAISLLNLTGVDGLARDRLWRDKATFTLDCTTPVHSESGRIAREQLFQHVDVVFYSKAYALSVNPSTPAQKLTPRSFLLSQVPLVSKHALLFVHWDHDGGALLSVPTREYLQSSVWTEPTAASAPNPSEQAHPTPVGPPIPSDPVNPPLDPRPETQLSLGSDDPRYREFSTISSNRNGGSGRPMPEWPDTDQGHARNATGGRHSLGSNDVHRHHHHHSGNKVTTPDLAEEIQPQIEPAAATFDYGFAADAFANVTPDSSWDYRANRTAVIYDSGDESESDYGAGAGVAGLGVGGGRVPRGLGLQTDVRQVGIGPSGVIISEGVALSPSDIDSDMDVNVAAGASRFVMEERMRRVYGPMEHDAVESDVLDFSSSENGGMTHENGNDSDATEGGRQRPSGPTRIGKLKRERMRLQEEQALELVRNELEEEERAFGQLEETPEKEQNDAASLHSAKSDAVSVTPKVLPPIPLGVVEAWQAGLLYSLTRNVLPGAPYCPTTASARSPGMKGEGLKPQRKPETQDSSEWGWTWRLDECLRFAAELAGRRARKGTMEGLAREMEESGWPI